MQPTVLIIDDEPTIRTLLSRFMERLGYIPTQASSGIDAETMIADSEPTLVLLDIMMPDQDGYETCRHIRENGYRGTIIMISALAPQQGEQLSKDCGADGYLQKPLSVGALQSHINALLI